MQRIKLIFLAVSFKVHRLTDLWNKDDITLNKELKLQRLKISLENGSLTTFSFKLVQLLLFPETPSIPRNAQFIPRGCNETSKNEPQ